MIDDSFRDWFPQRIDKVILILYKIGLTPNHITFLGFAISVVSALLIVCDHLLLGVLVWWASRLMDACDGILARKYQMTSLYGTFLDIQLDMAAYSLVILGCFFRFPELTLQWILILALYVLCITGALSLGHLEVENGLNFKSDRGLKLAAGLAEGGETGVAYTIFLLFPYWLFITTWIWIFVLSLTVVARFILAKKSLK